MENEKNAIITTCEICNTPNVTCMLINRFDIEHAICEEQCITPCIFPFHEDHDRPDGCCWDGISDFRVEFIEEKELLRIFTGEV